MTFPRKFVGSAVSLQRQGKTAILVVRRSSLKEESRAWEAEPVSGAQFEREFSGATGKDWEAVGFIAVSDTLRVDAAETVAGLKEMGVARIAMLTGDNRDVAETIAAEVGLQDVYPELLPEQKVEVVEALREAGTVAMVGDGINDAPAPGDIGPGNRHGRRGYRCCPGDGRYCAYVRRFGQAAVYAASQPSRARHCAPEYLWFPWLRS